MPQCITSAATCRRYEKPTGVGFANCAAGFRGYLIRIPAKGRTRTSVLALGLPEDKVRVISPYIGPAFGQRGSISPHTILAAVAARRVGRPVKLTVPRAQIFHATSFRAATGSIISALVRIATAASSAGCIWSARKRLAST